ncbi:MAG: ABC transporter substrate-binding protein, partial [Actinomycetota bacterium]
GVSEPTAIDPYNAQESEGILVTQQLFTGLVQLNNDNQQLEPGVASKWDKNADCTEWTFNLTPGTKFSNGEVVTAKSFIAGWTRAADQKAASDVSYHMGGIAGYAELNGGKAKDFTGVTAPDDNTLVVKLSAADCEFDKKTIQTVFSPVPSDAGAADNKTFNDLPIGNGPFKLKEPWQHDKSMTMVRNDDYFGTKANLDEVDVTITGDAGIDLEYKNFKAGQFDWSRVPPALLPEADKTQTPKGNFIKQVMYGINYILPMTFDGPTKSADARKAISYAIDRDAIIKGVFKGYQTKATSFVPSTFKAYAQEGVCTACTFDLAKAKELAAKSGLTPGTKLYFGFNTGGGHEAWTQAVAQQLKENLGLDVTLEGIPFKELLAKETKPTSTGIFRAAWGADYPTPDNFLFPLLSKKSINPDAKGVVQGDNRGRYDNPAFDALLVKERAAKTEEERVPIIKEAEKLAIDTDQAVIPLWYRTQYRVFDSSKWDGVKMDFFENPTLATISQK